MSAHRIFKNSSAYTLLEIIIVISILSIIIGTSIPFLVNSLNKSNLDSTSSIALSYLRSAQTKSITGFNSSNYGVYFDNTSSPNKIVIFKGTTYDANDENNEVYEAPRQVTISSIVLNGSTNQVVFDKYSGSTQNYGSITFKDINNEQIIIDINSIGRTNVSI